MLNIIKNIYKLFLSNKNDDKNNFLSKDDVLIEKVSLKMESLLRECKLVDDKFMPLNRLWTYNDFYISHNIKGIMEYFANERKNIVVREKFDKSLFPANVELVSKLSTQSDLEAPWCRYWLHELNIPFAYHRKNWEYAFVLQALYEHGMFGREGLGMASGREKLPSYLIKMGCKITAGDKPLAVDSENAWKKSAEYTETKKTLYFQDIIDEDVFENNFTLRYIDMNCLPQDLFGKFDFCWSVCAIEHLGSISNGCKFIKNSLKLLKPGGISVHTTEFNLLSNNITIDNLPDFCIYTRPIIENLKKEIEDKYDADVLGIDFEPGAGQFDKYIDMPPFPNDLIPGTDIGYKDAFPNHPHIKLLISGFPITCIGIIIRKK